MQSAKLAAKPPVCDVSEHGSVVPPLYEHELRDLPGISLNRLGDEIEDEIWLSIERLHETRPPAIDSAFLLPWAQLAPNPTTEPSLRPFVAGLHLIAAGTHRSTEEPDEVEHDEGDEDADEDERPFVDPAAQVFFDEYEEAALVRSELVRYMESRWRPWAAAETLRRKTITLYSRFFTLKQALEGGIVESQIELVWGAGQALWRTMNRTVNYPLVTRPVQMTLNPETAAIELRPRDIDARTELDWFSSINNPGVAALEKVGQDFFEKATTTFSPFDAGTFEPFLRSAVANLDAKGIYWPDEVEPEDRTLPKPGELFTVTDTWVVFVRPRNNNALLQDLERLKAKAEQATTLPPAIAALSSDPITESVAFELPEYRGVSAYSSDPSVSAGAKALDLYFPKAFNDEQLRIIQLLDVSDGVVVQGPPGTGKTHTIANVICHYLASGKRVLVTSMKDPALAVLHEQLPDEIQPVSHLATH